MSNVTFPNDRAMQDTLAREYYDQPEVASFLRRMATIANFGAHDQLFLVVDSFCVQDYERYQDWRGALTFKASTRHKEATPGDSILVGFYVTNDKNIMVCVEFSDASERWYASSPESAQAQGFRK